MALLSGLAIGIGAESAELSTELTKAERRTRRFRQRTEQDFDQLARNVATAAAAAVAAVGGIAVQATRAASEISVQARAAGIAADRFQSLSFTLKQVGLDVDELTDISATLSERLFDAAAGSSDLQEAFAALGLSFRDFENLSPEDAVLKLFDALQDVESASLQTAAASILLGDNGIKLAGALRRTNESLSEQEKRLRDIGAVISNEAVRNAESLTRQFNELSQVSFASFATGFLEAAGAAREMDAVLIDIGNSANFAGESVGNLINFIVENFDILATLFGAAGLSRITRGWNSIAGAIGLVAVGLRRLVRVGVFALLIEGVLLLVDSWDGLKRSVSDNSPWVLLRVAAAESIAFLVNGFATLPTTVFQILGVIADLFNTTFVQVTIAIYEEFRNLIDRLTGAANESERSLVEGQISQLERRSDRLINELDALDERYGIVGGDDSDQTGFIQSTRAALNANIQRIGIEIRTLNATVDGLDTSVDELRPGFDNFGERLTEQLGKELEEGVAGIGVIELIDPAALARLLGVSETERQAALKTFEDGASVIGGELRDRFEDYKELFRDLGVLAPAADQITNAFEDLQGGIGNFGAGQGTGRPTPTGFTPVDFERAAAAAAGDIEDAGESFASRLNLGFEALEGGIGNTALRFDRTVRSTATDLSRSLTLGFESLRGGIGNSGEVFRTAVRSTATDLSRNLTLAWEGLRGGIVGSTRPFHERVVSAGEAFAKAAAGEDSNFFNLTRAFEALQGGIGNFTREPGSTRPGLRPDDFRTGAGRTGDRVTGPRPQLRQDITQISDAFFDELRQGFFDAISSGNLSQIGRSFVNLLEAEIIEGFANTLAGNLAIIAQSFIERVFTSAFAGNAGFGATFRSIFGFQDGGIVPGSPGSAQLILAHAGEVVLNPTQQRNLLGQLGGGRTTVNVINSSGANVEVEEYDSPDGQQVIDVAVTGSLNRQAATGDLDGVFGAFGGNRGLIGR